MTKQVKYVDRESYKHLLAKELLAKWCRKAEKEARKNNAHSAKMAQFGWNVNQGVHTELQFCQEDCSYYLENRYPGDTPRDGSMQRSNKFGKILFVPDVSIFSKGEIRVIFEVKHTHGVTEKKLNLIKERLTMCSVYEIEAEEILRHKKNTIPDFLECKTLIW